MFNAVSRISRKFARVGALAGISVTLMVVPLLEVPPSAQAMVVSQGLHSSSVITDPPRIAGISLTATAINETEFSLTWTGGAGADTLTVLGGIDSSLTVKTFEKDLPATETSTVMQIPKALINHMGSRTGNPVYFQIEANNEVDMVLSNVAWALPRPPGASGKKVSFATYNVNSFSGLSSRTWKQRRVRVANVIARSNATVVGVQEASTGTYTRASGKRMPRYRDLGILLKKRGYTLAYPIAAVGKGANIHAKASHIFYRKSRAAVVKVKGKRQSGLVSMRAITPSTSWRKSSGATISNRHFSWAKMRLKSNGQQFFVVSAHLPYGNDAGTNRVKTAVARGIDRYIGKKNPKKLPVVILADVNTFAIRDPDGAQTALYSLGYLDASATSKRINTQYGTMNTQTRNSSYSGYPPTPYLYKYQGTRIDYILMKNGKGSYRYENHIVVNPNGRFTEKFRGSDHNLQKAILGL